MTRWSLPRSLRQQTIGLRSRVERGQITPDEAGAKLADHIREKWPSIADALLVRWCTARFRKSIPLPEGWVQQDLWPPHLWQQPLREALAYSQNSVGMTSRWHRRDELRELELDVLRRAAGGDLSMTLEDAYRRAHPDEEAEAV